MCDGCEDGVEGSRELANLAHIYGGEGWCVGVLGAHFGAEILKFEVFVVFVDDSNHLDDIGVIGISLGTPAQCVPHLSRLYGTRQFTPA